MIFTYRCKNGHVAEFDMTIGTAPPVLYSCMQNHKGGHPSGYGFCNSALERAIDLDAPTMQFGTVDPFRAYHLSSKKIRAEGAQQRYIGGPQDLQEKRALEKQHGRIYVGDESSSMSKKAQRGIDSIKDRVKQGEVNLS